MKVRQHLKVQHRRQKQHYDRKVAGTPYTVGDKVWLHSPAVPRGRSKKFHRPWQGPYTVTKVISDTVYRVKKVDPLHKGFVVYFDRLKPHVVDINKQTPERPNASNQEYEQSSSQE